MEIEAEATAASPAVPVGSSAVPTVSGQPVTVAALGSIPSVYPVVPGPVAQAAARQRLKNDGPVLAPKQAFCAGCEYSARNLKTQKLTAHTYVRWHEAPRK